MCFWIGYALVDRLLTYPGGRFRSRELFPRVSVSCTSVGLTRAARSRSVRTGRQPVVGWLLKPLGCAWPSMAVKAAYMGCPRAPQQGYARVIGLTRGGAGQRAQWENPAWCLARTFTSQPGQRHRPPVGGGNLPEQSPTTTLDRSADSGGGCNTFRDLNSRFEALQPPLEPTAFQQRNLPNWPG